MYDLDYDALAEQVELALERRKRILRFILLGAAIIQFVLLAALGWGVVFPTPIWETPTQEFVEIERVYRAMALLVTSGIVGLVLYGLMLAMDAERFDKSMRGQLLAQEIGQAMIKDMPKQKRDSATIQTDSPEIVDEMVLHSQTARLRMKEGEDG